MLSPNESGFINSDIIDECFEKHFVPYIQQMREKHKCSSSAVLILDGLEYLSKCAMIIRLKYFPSHLTPATKHSHLILAFFIFTEII